MKTITLPLVCLIQGLTFASTLFAQGQVIITGDSCVGNTVRVQAISGVPKRIEWYLDNVLLQVSSTWKATGSIVVAGNGQGSAASQLSGPQDVFVDKNKSIYIVDDGFKRVQKWVPGASQGVTVAGGNGKGSEANQFFSPTSVWVDDAGNVYVSDYLKNRIQKWAPGATSGVTVAGGNGEGAAANQFAGPRGICMDKAGNLYVADRWNHRVQKWAPGATLGVTVAGGHGKGFGADQFYEPLDLALDDAGNLYVIDQFNNRVQKWAPGATSGVTVIGQYGTGRTANQTDFFSAISVDAQGIIYVVDRNNSRIQRWSPNATYGITVAGSNGYGPAANQISTTFGIYADNTGNVYVADLFENRIRKFSRDTQATPTFLTSQTGLHKAVVTLEGTTVKSNATRTISAVPKKPQAINGPYNVYDGQIGLVYSIKNSVPGVHYNWVIPAGATITAGQGTPQITVNWGQGSGGVGATASNHCGTSALRAMSVTATYPPVTGSFDGYLDKVECGSIRGWVWDRQKANTVLVVEFYEGNTILGQTNADIYRQDLKDKNKGNGMHAYWFETPARLKDGKPHPINARILGSTFVLKGSPQSLTCSPSARLAVEAPEVNLQVNVLGNPLENNAVSVEVKGAEKQSLRFQILDSEGRLVLERQVNQAELVENHHFDIGNQPAGLLLLKVNTPYQSQTVKLIKP